MSIKKLFVVAAIAAAALSSHAGVILGGSTLVDGSSAGQLENWLGNGSLALTNIFTKTNGSTSADFHSAVDGQGATFTLLSVSYGGVWKTLGGYNPQSWSSAGDYNFTYSESDWTAFIFNLTDLTKFAQTNYYQTLNSASQGPTFGGGYDLGVSRNLLQGYSLGYSYGAGMDTTTYSPGTDFGVSIFDGTTSGYDLFTVGALEVFSVATYLPTNNVPEPNTLAMLGLGLVALAATNRKNICK